MIAADTGSATGLLDMSPAGELYGLRSINYGTVRTELMCLDKMTGAALSSVIPKHNGANVVPCGGLTFAPNGKLYIHDGSQTSFATPRLFTVNVATGEGSPLCTMPFSYRSGLAAMPAARPPVVTAIDPGSAVTGTSVTCTITGAGLATSCTVRLERAGQTAIPGGGVTFVHSASLTATFDLSGAQTGPWDVVVTNHDHQAGASSDYTYTPATADEGSTLSITATVTGVSGPAASLTVYPEGGVTCDCSRQP